MLDVAIVGGGVAGCYSAFRLAGARPRWDVQIFEMSDRLGGRLWSVPMDGVAGGPAEIGGMYFGDMQENVFGLVTRELRLPSAKVNWSRRSQYLRGLYLDDTAYTDNRASIPFNLPPHETGKTPSDLLMAALGAIVPDFLTLWPLDTASPGVSAPASVAHLRTIVRDGRHLHDWGFWNLLAQVVSNEAYSLLVATMGSAAIFRNANAYDAIWTFMLEIAPAQEYFRLTEGYQSLAVALAAPSQQAGALHLGARVGRIAHAGGRFVLHVERASGDDIIEARRVVLCLPKRAIELIDIDASVLAGTSFVADLDAVTPVPACKIFFAFSTPWWDQSSFGPTALMAEDVSVSYTDLPMRQCYYFGAPQPGTPALLMASYADDVATSFWSGLMPPGDAALRPHADPGRAALRTSYPLETAALAQLSAMHHDYGPPPPIDALFFDWSADPYGAAWHAWAPFCKSWEVMARLRRPNAALKFFACGEVFAQHQGWVEGALNSAEMVLRDLGLDRPGWVRADYAFEV